MTRFKGVGQGKVHSKLKLPTKVPKDYLRYSNFRPCFGYVYVVNFQDIEPCYFEINRNSIKVIENLLSIAINQGLITVEMTAEIQEEFWQIVRENDTLCFVAYPNYKKKYTDKNGLKVIPFYIKYFVYEEDFDRLVRDVEDRTYSIGIEDSEQ